MIIQPTSEPMSVAAFQSVSNADIAKMLDPKAEPIEVKDPEPEKAKEPEVESEVAIQQEEHEEELPKGVQKRIAKEVERQAELDRKINEARSATKAKEAELEKLTSGAEPVKNTEKVTGKPVRPDINTFPGTLEEYMTATAKYDSDFEAYLRDETTKTVEQNFTKKQQDEHVAKLQADAKAKHGEDFDTSRNAVFAATEQDLQLAISEMDNWDGLVMHLGKNPTELKAIADLYKQSPAKAVAALGKLEDKLAAAVKVDDKLPPPLKKIGGDSAAGNAPDLNKLTGSAFNREMRRVLAKK